MHTREFAPPPPTRMSVSTCASHPRLDQADLTPAEREVLGHLLTGLSNKEIASVLNKAEPTVKHQVSACLRKFGLSSRMRLMAALR